MQHSTVLMQVLIETTLSFSFYFNLEMCFYYISSSQHLQPIRFTVCRTSQLHYVASHWAPEGTKPPIRGQSGSSTLECDAMISIFSWRQNWEAPPTYLNPPPLEQRQATPLPRCAFDLPDASHWWTGRALLSHVCVIQSGIQLTGYSVQLCPLWPTWKWHLPPLAGQLWPKHELRLKSS